MLRLYLHIMGVLYTARYKMKGLPRRYDIKCIALLCIMGILVMMSFSPVEAQTTAKELLALKEAELNMFVDAVERNSGDCHVMNGCSSECSRSVCYKYGIPKDPKYQCLGVANNTYLCDTPTCAQRNFDFSRSFIRSVDPVDSHTARTVCTHRSLDAHFKNSTIANSSHLFRVYFGAVDGTWRIYPGADELCDNEVDNRIRPWYLESIDIPKVVTVLIDSGLFMRGLVTGSNQETYISKGITTALKLLETLRENLDYVTCICFDGDAIKPALNATRVYNVGVYQSLNESLTRMVVNGSKSDPTAAQTNSAINFTINQLGQLTDLKLIPTNYLKVVVAFIGGQQYRNISELNVTQIPNVNLFIYNFRATGKTPQCIPALRASFEEIPNERLNNPLYALLSYYSFLGKLHRSFMKNVTNFGTQHKDYSGIDDHTLTLSKAAFGPNGELLGVVGLDFFERKILESYSNIIQWDSIVEEAGKHDPGRMFNTLTDLSTNVCFNQTDPCPGLDSADVRGILCPNVSDDAKIGCCGTCRASSVPVPAPEPEPEHQHVQLKPWMIALIVVAGVLLCCLGVCVVFILRKTPRPKPPSITKYPGVQVSGG